MIGPELRSAGCLMFPSARPGALTPMKMIRLPRSTSTEAAVKSEWWLSGGEQRPRRDEAQKTQWAEM